MAKFYRHKSAWAARRWNKFRLAGKNGGAVNHVSAGTLQGVALSLKMRYTLWGKSIFDGRAGDADQVQLWLLRHEHAAAERHGTAAWTS